MRRIIAAIALSGLGTGCRGTPDEPVELVEHCGQREPTRLLELDANRYPSRNALHAIRRVGDRLVYFIEVYADGVAFPAESSADIIGNEVYASGLCGEDPVLLTDEVDFLFDPRHEFGGEILGCRREADEVILLDPTGADPARVLLSGVGCSPLPVGGGIVGVRPTQPDPETGELIYKASLADPDSQVEVLMPEVLTPFAETSFYFADIRRLRTTGDDVLALAPSGDIVSVDVTDQSTKIEVADVGGFELSFDGRFILWEEGPPVLAGQTWEAREMFLRDRDTGQDLALGLARFGIGSAGVQPGMVRATADFINEDTLVVLLPSQEQFTFGSDQFVNGRHPDSGFIMWSPSADDGTPGPLHVFDPELGESEAVFDRYGGWAYEGEQFLLLENTGEDEYALWERYLDQPEPELVVTSVFQPFFVSETRVAAIRDLEGDRHGSLHIIDRNSEMTLVVADRVNAFSARLNWLHALGDAFAYAEADETGGAILAARVD